MKVIATLLVIIVVTAFVRWLLKPRNALAKNTKNMRSALTRLLKRPYGAYVIIEEPSFGKFVQFSGSANEPLMFDLQRQSLTLDEFEKACQLFRLLGYPEPETFAVYDGGRSPVTTQTSFIVPFDDDIETATTLALEVFAKVYGINSSMTLILTES